MQVLRNSIFLGRTQVHNFIRSPRFLSCTIARPDRSFQPQDPVPPAASYFPRRFSTRPDPLPSPPPAFPLNPIRFDRVAATWRLLSASHARFNTLYTTLSATRYGRLMRLDKPIGTHLLFLPGAWGIAIGASSVPDLLGLTGLFYAGALLTRGAGCTVNDIWDQDIDRQVERTKSRPLASGEVSTQGALVLLSAQLLGGLAVLTQLNTECFLLGTAAVIPILFYPLAKRSTPFPQAVLGLTFNWGALMGYCAATGTLQMPALLLYGAGWCWTMVYDTIYAYQDKEDDEKIGVQSTALTFGENTKPVLAALSAAKLALLCGAGFAADLSLPYYMGVTASTIHLGYQIAATDLSNPVQCHKAFTNNSATGAITWASILAGRLF